MSGLLAHVGLFAAVSFAIVVMGAFYGERDDARALAGLPRRFLVFLVTCAGIAVAMLVVEWLFVSLD